jgi:membrane fusion protein, multidrug efflux system
MPPVSVECERARALTKSGAISQAELDRVETKCQTSTSAVSAAQARARLTAQAVGDGAIRAPFAGVVTDRYVADGEFVHADSRVATVVDLDALRLELTIPEANIATARAGTRLKFTVAGYPDRPFSATLKFVGASVRNATRDVVAEAVLDDPDPGLRPGMFASVRIATGEQKTPVVPRGAVVTRDGKTTSFVVVDGRVEQRIVQIGDVFGGDVAVTRGLIDGDKIVTAPDEKLRNGLRVAAN